MSKKAFLTPGDGVVIHVDCRCCGYEPMDYRPTPLHCPKCGGTAWDRYVALNSIAVAIPMALTVAPKVCNFLPQPAAVEMECEACSTKSS